MATMVTCWCASLGKVINVLASVAYKVNSVGDLEEILVVS